MFIFYHSKQKTENRDYYKGVLFEELLKKYLFNCGYDVELRRKRNSLEYDIMGHDRTTRQKIIGEAKAHEKPISGAVLSSFVGKLLPEGLIEKEVFGLFLSISALTPDADDYYEKTKVRGIRSITGNELFKTIKTELKFSDTNFLKQQVEIQGYFYVAEYALITDVDYFQVIVLRKDTSGTASFFAVFNKEGSLISDNLFIDSLKKNITELQALEPFLSTNKNITKYERIINNGLIVGTTWVDYRLPAGPNFFIGREDFVSKIIEHINRNDGLNILQIKSRSGVGKSSFLAFIENLFQKKNYRTELHDSRDIKSPLDIYTIIQRFTNSNEIANDIKDVNDQISKLYYDSSIEKAVFMIDQFESTFNNPDIFNLYESIANIFLNFSNKIYFILARKNDQLTTYDDLKISLEKINSYSIHFELHDFSKNEAIALIMKISEESSGLIKNEVSAYVLEFAQGFPWLLKRTMAHIIKLIRSGFNQKELFSLGLKLDDLFNEELEELDELERDYLRRLASQLPADFNQLQRQFDEDPYLPKVLDKLTRARILRLSGSTYDTYNDVFKEYLKYQKLPDFKQQIIYRMYPNQVISTFHKLVDENDFSIEYLKKTFRISKGSAFNLIKELQNLNLIKGSDNKWHIPQTVKDVYKIGKLGEYIRRQIIENDIVASLLNNTLQNQLIHTENLENFISDKFPFIVASEKTWKTYATMLKSWLNATKVLMINADGYLNIPDGDRTVIIENLGNLYNIDKVSRRTTFEFFLPGIQFNRLMQFYHKLTEGKMPQNDEEKKALRELRKCGWVSGNNIVVKDLAELKVQAIKLITTEYHHKIYTAILNQDNVINITRNIIGKDLSIETITWRINILLNWAREFEIIDKSRYKYHPSKIKKKKLKTKI